MRLTRALTAFGVLAVCASTACKNSTEPEGGKVVTPMTCESGTGTTANCEIPLGNSSKFTITLLSTSCSAPGNVLKVIKPRETTITTDGCYTPAGQVWTFDGPFQSSATMAMTVTSQAFAEKPQLRVSGTSPLWTVKFEDGADVDFDDMVFEIKTVP